MQDLYNVNDKQKYNKIVSETFTSTNLWPARTSYKRPLDNSTVMPLGKRR